VRPFRAAGNGLGFVLNMRVSSSSKPMPSPLDSYLGELGGGLGFDDFPDFVPLK
jgi:hypothetical protein